MEALMSTSKENKLWGENVSIEPQQKSENRTVFEATGSMPITGNDSAKRECKSIGKISGIYKIINKVNGKY